MLNKQVTPMQMVGIVIVVAGGIAYLGHQKQEERRAAEAERQRVQAQTIERQRLAEERRVQAEQERAIQEAARRRAEAEQARTEVATALLRLKAQAQRFDDTNKLANSTARIALAQPVSQLQAIKRETQDMFVPSCLQGSKGSLVSAMDDYIGGYLAFMQLRGQQAESAAARHFQNASTHLTNFLERLKRCEA